MGINWYKMADTDGLRPNDLFLFYAFMSSPEDFVNRKVLIDVAEKMNHMRNVYLH